MRFRDWILVYFATGSTFTRWAILAFYGGAVVGIGVAAIIGLALFVSR